MNTKAGLSWTQRPEHRSWLAAEAGRLLQFSAGSEHPDGGFAWMDGSGRPELIRPVESWITTRMTHVLAIGAVMGIPGCAPLVDHGIASLRSNLADAEFGGWFSASDRPNNGEKRAYEQHEKDLQKQAGPASFPLSHFHTPRVAWPW